MNRNLCAGILSIGIATALALGGCSAAGSTEQAALSDAYPVTSGDRFLGGTSEGLTYEQRADRQSDRISLAEARELMGRRELLPDEPLGRELTGVWKDGSKGGHFSDAEPQVSALFGDDLVVAVHRHVSDEAASEWFSLVQLNPAVDVAGNATEPVVGTNRAWGYSKVERTLSKGKDGAVIPGVFIGDSRILWVDGDMQYCVWSESLPLPQLVTVARTIAGLQE